LTPTITCAILKLDGGIMAYLFKTRLGKKEVQFVGHIRKCMQYLRMPPPTDSNIIKIALSELGKQLAAKVKHAQEEEAKRNSESNKSNLLLPDCITRPDGDRKKIQSAGDSTGTDSKDQT